MGPTNPMLIRRARDSGTDPPRLTRSLQSIKLIEVSYSNEYMGSAESGATASPAPSPGRRSNYAGETYQTLVAFESGDVGSARALSGDDVAVTGLGSEIVASATCVQQIRKSALTRGAICGSVPSLRDGS